MEFIVNTQDLREHLSNVISVADKKNIRPILSLTSIEVNSEQNSLVLYATDLEVSLKLKTRATVVASGSFCINPKKLFDIMREMPNSEVHFKSSNDKKMLEISCNKIKFSLLIVDSSEFPIVNFDNTKSIFTINSNTLKKIIENSQHSMSTDETRPFFNGMFFQTINNSLFTVATDAYCLSLTELKDFNIDNTLLKKGVIIPRKGIIELRKITEQLTDTGLSFYLDESILNVFSDNISLSIRLINKEFPDYQRIVNSKTLLKIDVERERFVSALKRIRILADEKSNKIFLAFSKNELIVTANNLTLGEAEEKIKIDFSDYEKDIKIAFNAKYLIETVNLFNSDTFSFNFNNEISPMFLKSNCMPEFLGLVQPLQF